MEKITLKWRIRVARDEAGLSQKALGDALGKSRETIVNWEKGSGEPSSTIIKKISQICNSDENWLLTGSGDNSPTITAFPKPSYAKNKVPSGGLSERYVLVPLYDVEASCGGGAIVHSEQIIDHLAFLRDWIVGELGLNADRVMLIKALGDSMEPTIKDGALLLVDRNLDRPTGDAVYVIRQEGDLLVKRIQNLMDGTVKIISSNPDYETLTVQASSLEVLGKVVWGGQKI